jgi:hypothetical protein
MLLLESGRPAGHERESHGATMKLCVFGFWRPDIKRAACCELFRREISCIEACAMQRKYMADFVNDVLDDDLLSALRCSLLTRQVPASASTRVRVSCYVVLGTADFLSQYCVAQGEQENFLAAICRHDMSKRYSTGRE